MEIAVGSYAGNSVNGRDIDAGVSWTPVMVWVYSSDGAHGVSVRTSAMPGIFRLADSTGVISGNITALQAGGFRVANDANVNLTGVTYHYVCFRDAPGELKVGSYAGNGADSRNITGVGFQPAAVLTFPSSSAVYGALWFASKGGDNTWNYGGHSVVSDWVQGVHADGFQVGATGANASGTTYYYVCLKEVEDNIKQSTYAGNGSDNHNITTVGFQPEILIIRTDAGNGYLIVYRADPAAGDVSQLENWTVGSDLIQSFLADGFQVGTDQYVNANGTTYHYLAIRALVIIELRRTARLEIDAKGWLHSRRRFPIEAAGQLPLRRRACLPIEATQNLISRRRFPIEAWHSPLVLPLQWDVLRQLSESFPLDWDVIQSRLAVDLPLAWDVRRIIAMDLPLTWDVIPAALVQLFDADIQLPTATVDKT